MLTVKACEHSISTLNFDSFRFKSSRPKFLPLEKQKFRIKNDKKGLNTVHWTEEYNNQAKYYLIQKWNSQLVISRDKIAWKSQCRLRIHDRRLLLQLLQILNSHNYCGGGVVSPLHCATAGFHSATANRKSSAAATKTNSHRSIFRHVAFGFLMNGGN